MPPHSSLYFLIPLLFSLLLSPRLCANSGAVMCLCSQSPSGSQLSVIYSLISPSRSSLALAPYGRELRWQLALHHSPEPGQVDTATHTDREKSTCWRANKQGRHIIGHNTHVKFWQFKLHPKKESTCPEQDVVVGLGVVENVFNTSALTSIYDAKTRRNIR